MSLGIAFFIPAAVAALITWTSVLAGLRAIEFIAKPATMILLAIAAALLKPAGEPVHWLIVSGLLLGGLGDVLLMGGVSVRALAPFLAGHLAYILAFTAQRQNLPVLIAAGLVGLAAILVYQRWLVAGLRASGDEKLVRPVLLYMIVIVAMTATACATLNPLAAAGAILFLASDGLFAWYHFVGPLRWGRPVNIVLYQCGQALIAASLALVST
ncbi:MAG TPA: lysoplasmalogenase [Candidatus Dormibacteraeota bacterium]